MSDVAPLLEIMRRLRDPDNGCPWDVGQTFASIAPYTIEEAYEVADVIARQAWDELPDELGDLLFQIAFYVQMAEERGWFGFDAVLEAIVSKMIRRHPHVFADARVDSASEQSAAWEAHKRAERGSGGSILDAVPRGLASLKRAQKLQKRAAAVGFDWPDATAVTPKLHEELAELEQAVCAGGEAVAEELGDLMFTCVNLARHLEVDLDAALRSASLKFERRFRAMEALAEAESTSLDALSGDELERYWETVKNAEHANG